MEEVCNVFLSLCFDNDSTTALVLIVDITIPHRQHQLKPGLAIMIVRDNAIAIATTDQPPKFQCSFLIRHIKKYGDFINGFVFETGNKCPKGEHTFLIRCTDNKQLFNLLDGLANRSMTVQDIVLEKTFSEIAIPQGPLPRKPIIPKPSFNFDKLSQNQLRQNVHGNTKRQKLLSTSDVSGSHGHHKALTNSLSDFLPYYNMESGQKNYQNLGPDGKSIVPEVEYEIIPEDLPKDVFVEDKRIK